MGLLKNARIYLSGPIESKEDATSWRQDVTTGVKPLGIQIWDPLVKPKWQDSAVDGKRQREMRADLQAIPPRSVENIKRANDSIRKFGQHLASNCDIVVIRVDRSFTVGTWEELAIARYKPVFVLTDKDDTIPSLWLVDQLDAYHNIGFVFHSTVHSLVYLLNRIDSGQVEVPDQYKWVFLTYRRSDHVGVHDEA